MFSGSASAPDMKIIASLAHHSPIINKLGKPDVEVYGFDCTVLIIRFLLWVINNMDLGLVIVVIVIVIVITRITMIEIIVMIIK